MNGKSLVNLQISVEEVENIDGLVRGGYYGSQSDAKRLTKGILLSINRFVDESANLKIEKVVGKKMNGKILVDMQITAEEIEDVGVLSERDIMGAELIRSRISPERSSVY
ncbi:MAG: hypothetical protein WBD09_05510 [Halobacteriota archaeon]